MGKVKYRKSLKAAFAKYVLVALLGALVLSVILSTVFQYAQPAEYGNDNTQFYYSVEENQGSIITDSTVINSSPSQIWLYNFFGLMSVAVYPICFIVLIIVASILFYKNELQKPFAILNDAANHIKNNNLDFTVSYDKANEFGDLCVSFDKMRMALKDNYMEIWRQAEERKRLNSAFAHDLRTPLTVLKGQSDMLIKYSPGMSAEKISEAADMMKRHIERMERYVETMNSVQRLEDIEISKTVISINEVCDPLKITGASVCGNKEFICDISISEEQDVRIDLAAVMQVCENLLVNAGRYAKSKISLSIGIHNNYFIIEIADDGKGFSAEELLCAANPFYKSNEKTDEEHLGMGLYICKILCEKHGGYLKLKNDNGATITAAFQM